MKGWSWVQRSFRPRGLLFEKSGVSISAGGSEDFVLDVKPEDEKLSFVVRVSGNGAPENVSAKLYFSADGNSWDDSPKVLGSGNFSAVVEGVLFPFAKLVVENGNASSDSNDGSVSVDVWVFEK